MYILYLIVSISFLGMMAIFAYRLWKIKKDKVFLSENIYSDDEYPEVLYNFCEKYVNKVFFVIKKHLPWCRNKLIRVTSTIVERSNATMIKKMIDGKRSVGSEKKSASLYLKDITEHKNSIKKQAIND